MLKVSPIHVGVLIEFIDNLVLRSDLCPWLRHDLVSSNPLPGAVPLSNPPVPRDSSKAA